MLRLVEPVERALKRRPALWRADRSARRGSAAAAGDAHRSRRHRRLRTRRPAHRGGARPARASRGSSSRSIRSRIDEAAASSACRCSTATPAARRFSSHAALERARALVITLPDDAAALAVVDDGATHAPELHIVARASTWEGARRLAHDGADDVVRPELEGGVEIVRRTLLELDLPVRDVQRYTDLVRREGLDESERPSGERTRVLRRSDERGARARSQLADARSGQPAGGPHDRIVASAHAHGRVDRRDQPRRAGSSRIPSRTRSSPRAIVWRCLAPPTRSRRRSNSSSTTDVFFRRPHGC